MENWKAIYLFLKKKKSLHTNTQRELRIFFPSVSMFFQGHFGGSSYLAEKNWSPNKCDHSPHCGLETFPTYRRYKKLLMFFQGPTVCFSRLQRRKTGWWVRFYLSCGMTHSARVSDPEFLPFLIHRPHLYFSVFGKVSIDHLLSSRPQISKN